MKSKNAPYYLAGVVSLITGLVYLFSLQNGFVEWDDNLYVFENLHIRSITPDFFRWAFSTFHAGNWHPLTWISHALDYAVWGLNPLGHHLTNDILHAVNTLLVVLLVTRLVGTAGERTAEGVPASFPDEQQALIAGGVTGLLFGLHPVHVESVVWIAERKDLLCAMFYLLSIMMYLKYAAEDVSARTGTALPVFRKYYLLTLVFFILALLSKPMAVSLPVVLLILDWYPLARIGSRKTFRRAVFEKIPLIALSLASSVVTVLAQKAGGTMVLMETVPFSTRLLVAAGALISYLRKMILPADLLFFYPYPRDVSFSSATYLAALVLVVAITAVFFVMVKRQRLWLAVWTYYVVTLLPVIGLVQVGMQSQADRYTYLPSLGPFLVAGLAVATWMPGRAHDARTRGRAVKVVAAAVGIVMLVLSVLTIRQIGVWKDSITLWSSVIEKDPQEVFFAFHNRGIAFSRLGAFDKAIADYYKAIALKPNYADTHSNLGIALLNKGLREQAIAEYQTAIRLKPDFADAHRNLAVALYTSGNFAGALKEYLVVASLRPEDAGAYADLGSAYGAMGDYDKAIENFLTALRLRPDFADAHYNLAVAYSMTGQLEKAREHYEAAYRLSPRSTGPGNTPRAPMR